MHFGEGFWGNTVNTLRVSHFESHFDEGFWGNTVNTLRVTLVRVSGVTLLTL